MASSRDDFIIAIRSAFLKKSNQQKLLLGVHHWVLAEIMNVDSLLVHGSSREIIKNTAKSFGRICGGLSNHWPLAHGLLLSQVVLQSILHRRDIQNKGNNWLLAGQLYSCSSKGIWTCLKIWASSIMVR